MWLYRAGREGTDREAHGYGMRGLEDSGGHGAGDEGRKALCAEVEELLALHLLLLLRQAILRLRDVELAAAE